MVYTPLLDTQCSLEQVVRDMPMNAFADSASTVYVVDESSHGQAQILSWGAEWFPGNPLGALPHSQSALGHWSKCLPWAWRQLVKGILNLFR